jgi:hypothetical protein
MTRRIASRETVFTRQFDEKNRPVKLLNSLLRITVDRHSVRSNLEGLEADAPYVVQYSREVPWGKLE